MNFFKHSKHETTPVPVAATDKTADQLSNEAWSDPTKVILAGDENSMSPYKANRIAREVANSQKEPEDRNIRGINDILPAVDVDEFNATVAKELIAIDGMPDMARVHEIGKHIVVHAVESAPDRIEVHTGTRQDVA